MRAAVEENRVTLCGQIVASEGITEDPSGVSCLACQANMDLIRRHADGGLTVKLLRDILEELDYENEFGSLEECTIEAGVDILTEDLIEVFKRHQAVAPAN